MDATTFTERVCVVIQSSDVSDDEVRRRLGSALPLKFTRWEDRAYMAAIRSLRPRVIVVAAADERAADYAALLEALLDSDAPTIATLALSREHIFIQQLGAGEQAQILSLDDLLLR